MPPEAARLQASAAPFRGLKLSAARVLVRWSGTEPKLRFMVEGPEPDQLHSFCDRLAEAAKQDLA